MSERNLTATIETEIGQVEVSPAILVEMSFDGGTVRLWSGVGTLSWDSKTWTGTGYMGGISVIEETAALEARGIDLRLSGIPPETLALALGETYQGRPARVWIAFMDTDGAVLDDPLGPFGYLMDTMDIQDGTDTATVTMHAENRLRILDAASNRRSTDEDQKIDYPSDLGYEYVASLQDKELRWG